MHILNGTHIYQRRRSHPENKITAIPKTRNGTIKKSYRLRKKYGELQYILSEVNHTSKP